MQVQLKHGCAHHRVGVATHDPGWYPRMPHHGRAVIGDTSGTVSDRFVPCAGTLASMRTYSDLWDAVHRELLALDADGLCTVADTAGVPMTTLRKYLRGRQGISYARVASLAGALGLSVTVTHRYATAA